MFTKFPWGETWKIRKLSLGNPRIMDHAQILMWCLLHHWILMILVNLFQLREDSGILWKAGLVMTFILGDGSSLFLLPQFAEWGQKPPPVPAASVPLLNSLQGHSSRIHDGMGFVEAEKSGINHQTWILQDQPLTTPQNHQIQPKGQFFPHPEGMGNDQREVLWPLRGETWLQGCELVVTSGWKVTLSVTKNFCPDHEDLECKWRGLRWTIDGSVAPRSHKVTSANTKWQLTPTSLAGIEPGRQKILIRIR